MKGWHFNLLPFVRVDVFWTEMFLLFTYMDKKGTCDWKPVKKKNLCLVSGMKSNTDGTVFGS